MTNYLCFSTLDVKNYLLKVNKKLTRVEAVFVHILDISEVDNSQDCFRKTCYHMVFAVLKTEDE